MTTTLVLTQPLARSLAGYHGFFAGLSSGNPKGDVLLIKGATDVPRDSNAELSSFRWRCDFRLNSGEFLGRDSLDFIHEIRSFSTDRTSSIRRDYGGQSFMRKQPSRDDPSDRRAIRAALIAPGKGHTNPYQRRKRQTRSCRLTSRLHFVRFGRPVRAPLLDRRSGRNNKRSR
jgi:hypothetical protein